MKDSEDLILDPQLEEKLDKLKTYINAGHPVEEILWLAYQLGHMTGRREGAVQTEKLAEKMLQWWDTQNESVPTSSPN